MLGVLAVLGFGIWWGGHPDHLPGFLRDALVGDKDARVVREAIDRVHDNYFRAIPERRLANASIAGMIHSLGDRFSNYFTPREYAQFKDAQSSRFVGIGVAVSPDPRGLRVADVYDGSPAKRAGIRPGDRIVAVGRHSLAGRSLESATAPIKGPPGTDVRLTVLHAGHRRVLTVTRATVTVPVVASHLRTVAGIKLGTVRLTTFSSGAHAEVDQAVRRVLRAGAKGIVLDLRHNGGGLVDEAQLVASAFLRGGSIVTTRGRSVPSRTLDATGHPVAPSTPLVVLVDRDTASASEIVTGALQDRHRAEVVGTRTFGKGVFQEVIELSNGGALDITAGQYFTPKGRNLGGGGVKPGAGITPDVKARDNPRTPRDEALDTALHVLARRVA